MNFSWIMDKKVKDLILNEPVLSDEQLIFTTRARLARNIERYPFPHMMNEKQAEKLALEVVEAVRDIVNDTCIVIPMADVDPLTRGLMVERHLISPEFAEDGFGKILILFPRLKLRILVNEEDHLRISCYDTDGNLEKTWKVLDAFDCNLGDRIRYAFDKEFGYLTSCPTNIGSGLRISSIVFLPVLKATRKIKNIFQLLYKLGCVIRGFYGEGSPVMANFYQISTGNVLGKTEQEICEDFEAVISAIRQQEMDSTGLVNIATVKRNIKIFIDRIFSNVSGEISFDHAINGLSVLLFGKKLGIIQMRENLLKRLVYRIMPLSLQFEAGTKLEQVEQERFRFRILERELRNANVRAIL